MVCLNQRKSADGVERQAIVTKDVEDEKSAPNGIPCCQPVQSLSKSAAPHYQPYIASALCPIAAPSAPAHRDTNTSAYGDSALFALRLRAR